MKAIILLILSAISFGLYNLSLRSLQYTDIDTEDKCNDALVNDIINFKENGKCHAWDGTQCRKGKFNANKDCGYEGSYFPLFFLVLTIILLLYGLYSFFNSGKPETPSSFSSSSPLFSSSKMSRRSRRNKIL